MRSIEPPKIGIYAITNTVTGAVYIGQSIDIKARWRQHRCLLKTVASQISQGRAVGRRCNGRLVRSWAKYGEAAFSFSIIEECLVEDMTTREIFWLDHYRRNGKVFNTMGPVDNPWRGQKHSAQTRAKISAKVRAAPRRTEEWHRMMGAARRGKPMLQETKDKLRQAKMGRSLPQIAGAKNPSCRPEHRARMREDNPAKSEHARSAISAKAKKTVLCAETGEIWTSASECAIALRVSVSAISAQICGKNRTCKGRRLAYAVKDKDLP